MNLFKTTIQVNTRTYPRNHFISKRILMLEKIWVGFLVFNFCIAISAADLISLTTLIGIFVLNASGFIYYRNK